MARGWVSKAVEAQIEEGKQRPMETTASTDPKDVRLRQERLESLRLSRSRILQQLEHARHASYRQVLTNGLKAIEREIESLTQETKAKF
jgi:uncharacterized Zn finger protein